MEKEKSPEGLDVVQIGLRISDAKNNELNTKAKNIGISKNSLIQVYIDIGSKVYDSYIKLQLG